MTVEELNVKITADAEGFKSEIAAVNQSIEELRAKLRTAGVEATAAFSGMMKLAVQTNSMTPESGSAKPESASENAAAPAVTGVSAFSLGAPSYLSDMIPAARVPSLRRGETVVGAVGGGNGGDTAQTIQINTTVELDGDAVGEAVSRYSARQQRITND